MSRFPSLTTPIDFNNEDIRSNGSGWTVTVGGNEIVTNELSLTPRERFLQALINSMHRALMGMSYEYPQLSLPNPFQPLSRTQIPWTDMLEMFLRDEPTIARRTMRNRRNPGDGDVVISIDLWSARKTMGFFYEVRTEAYRTLCNRDEVLGLRSNDSYELKAMRVRSAIVACNLLIAYFGVRFKFENVAQPGFLSGIEEEIRLQSSGLQPRQMWPPWMQKYYEVAFSGERRDLEGIVCRDHEAQRRERKAKSKSIAQAPKSDRDRAAFYLTQPGYREMRGARRNNPLDYTVVLFDGPNENEVVAVMTSIYSENAAYFLRGPLAEILDVIKLRRIEIRDPKSSVYMGRVLHVPDGSWRGLIPVALQRTLRGERFGTLFKLPTTTEAVQVAS